ncbi:MAG: FadR family transcriptional regulator [Ardenticatenaceae bacterium]|nr:FadR family transcriptional regulator [Ardenticatenaceae bacterium]HBY93812.1 GntR family transcriptional regulator [Chloroflexota bacterium]
MKDSNIVGLLEPVRQQTATEAVAQQLIQLLMTGALAQGDRLPSERELAQHLHVGRTTVREALKLLTLSGVLEARRGAGTYVRHKYWSFVAEQIKWPALLQRMDVEELLEVRGPMEIQAARLAAERATPEDLSRIEAALDDLKALKERDVERETEIDMRFHRYIAEASRNSLLLIVMDALAAPLRMHIEQANRMTADTSSTIAEHRAVYEALRRHNPEAAAKAMSKHLDMSRFLALLGATDGLDEPNPTDA